MQPFTSGHAALFVMPLAFAASMAQAVPLSLNTGTAAWTVTQTTGVNSNGVGIGVASPAAVLTGTLPFAANLPGFEAFAWANPFGGAVWVGQLSTDGQFSNGGSISCGSPCGATSGNYTYSLSFDASNGGDLNLSGFTGDNGVRSLSVVQVNNGVLYGCTAAGPGTLCAATQTSVTAGTGLLGLAAVSGGLVTITAVVENLDGPGRNPSGFILAGVANITPVPEPATWALWGLGGLALWARSRSQVRAR